MKACIIPIFRFKKKLQIVAIKEINPKLWQSEIQPSILRKFQTTQESCPNVLSHYPSSEKTSDSKNIKSNSLKNLKFFIPETHPSSISKKSYRVSMGESQMEASQYLPKSNSGKFSAHKLR